MTRMFSLCTPQCFCCLEMQEIKPRGEVNSYQFYIVESHKKECDYFPNNGKEHHVDILDHEIIKSRGAY